MTETNKHYAEDLVMLPKRMTNKMVVAWFAAEKQDKPISECWDAVIEAFEQKTLYVFGESTVEMSPDCPFKRPTK